MALSYNFANRNAASNTSAVETAQLKLEIKEENMKKNLISLAVLGFVGLSMVSCGGSTRSEFNFQDAIADGELGYVILVGEDGNPEAEDRTQGCIDAMNEIAKEGGFKATLLDQHTCIDINGNSWNDTAAKTQVETWVNQFGDKLDFIVSNNDGMAVAAASASGLVKGTPIIGFDALSSACDMIKEGTLAGSVSQNGDDQALATVKALTNLIKGETVIDANYGGRADLVLDQLDEHIISTKLTAVTAANADEVRPGNYATVSEDSAVKGKKMLIAYYSANDNFIKETYHEALPHYAEAMGYEVTQIDGDGSNDTDLLQRVQAAVEQTDYDCFAFNIITHSNWKSYADLTEGKPTVFFNRQPKKSDNSGVEDLSNVANTYFVGSSSTGQGTAQGQIIKDWYAAVKA